MMIFTRRYQKAIKERKLSLSIPQRTRRRLWGLLQRYNEPLLLHPDPYDNYSVHSSTIEQFQLDLVEEYGVDHLEAFIGENGERGVVDLDGFVLRAYPGQVFDVIELFYAKALDEGKKLSFQRRVNEILSEERIAWRLVDGQCLRIDSAFIEELVIDPTQELMRQHGFAGALDEFENARNDLSAGDTKGAIQNAGKSFESALKKVVGINDGTAKTLAREFARRGYCNDLPEADRNAFAETVLGVLPFLRNRLGAHGQGDAVVEVPTVYADLAINLAASLIMFVVNKYVEKQVEADDSAESKAPENEEDGWLADDIPF